MNRYFRRDASGSTLRLTLGCLLSQQLGIELRRTGANNRMTFGVGEARLSDWMSTNAFVSWVVTERPWEEEAAIIQTACLPLNRVSGAGATRRLRTPGNLGKLQRHARSTSLFSHHPLGPNSSSPAFASKSFFDHRFLRTRACLDKPLLDGASAKQRLDTIHRFLIANQRYAAILNPMEVRGSSLTHLLKRMNLDFPVERLALQCT
jgi:GIY-YIG catalytic domain-containing protein